MVKRAKKPASQVKKRRKLDPDDPDFDSEAEYGDEAREYVSSSEEEEDDDDLSDASAEVKHDDKPAAAAPAAKGTARPGLSDKDFVVKDAPLDEYLIKREATLIALLKRSFKSRVIIFVNEKVQATRLMALMTMYGFKAAEVHGNLSQEERLKSVEAFQCGDVDYLIGTDLVARGLDISNVKAVINFSFPTEPKRYLHRIGRTARAGQHGIAITLCNEEERKDLKKLSRKLNQTLNTFTI
jgi:superfamily II DNA/RNA helicase